MPMTGDDKVMFLHGGGDDFKVPLGSYLFNGVLHPIPLSVLALSILAAVRLSHTWRQPRVSRIVPDQAFIQSPGPDLPHRDNPSQSSVRQAPDSTEPHAGSSRSGGKKKRTKERRKRGKDVSKEATGKHARAVRSRDDDTNTRWNDDNFQHDESYASSSSTPLLTPRQGGAFSQADSVEDSIHSSEADHAGADASSMAQEGGDSLDYFPASRTSFEKVPTPVDPLALYLPVPPSDLTMHILSTMTYLDNSSRFESQPTTSFPVEDGLEGDSTSPSQRSLSPTPSTSGLSVTISSVPSSSLSPKTPPPALPVAQSLPSGINKGMFESLQNMKMGEPPVWERDTTPDEDDFSSPVDVSEDTRGRMTASVSAPAWDNSLDWTPIHGRLRANFKEDESWPPEMPSVASEHPPPSSLNTQDVFFPSLNDPPPNSGMPSSPALNPSGSGDVEVSKLKTALETARRAETRWKLESMRLAEELERLKWAWSEDLQKWNQKESELQHQLYRFMTLHTIQVQQQVAIASPISGSFPYYMNGQSSGTPQAQNGIPPSPVSIQAPLHGVYMGQPAPGILPLVYNPIGVLSSSPSVVPGPHSTALNANRRASHNSNGNSRPSRPPSRSRAPSPFPSAINTTSGPYAHSSPMTLHFSSPPARSSPNKHPGLSISASSSPYRSPSLRSFKGMEGSPAMDEDPETENDCIPDHLASAILKRPGSSSIASTTSNRSSQASLVHPIHPHPASAPYPSDTRTDVFMPIDINSDGVEHQTNEIPNDAEYRREKQAFSPREDEDSREETSSAEELESSLAANIDLFMPSNPLSATSQAL
ncbi:hypothetical protein BS47DRAFT_1394940 [Hydnum rufescens UP504]|uniref:Uncharacterized protein n=1 Tax=Hydnum rufescens UP504 TaxID=1448309 RepID=A0A9P6DVI3_9AGAM|nr:hypothetical protein BS47DRAFT_1394940 [Hydnum rufescens UP504]